MADDAVKARRLKVRHTVPHPPERVFDAWTDPDRMRRWMRPGPIDDARVELDVRVGGAFRIDMIDGEKVMAHSGEYQVVDRPKRLVFTWNADWIPGGSTVYLDFREVDGGTEIVLVHEGLPSEDSVENHRKGWASILEALADYMG